MPNEGLGSRDRWRVVVTRGSGSEVLFVESGRALALPEVEIPSKQRIAWHLNDQLKQVWQLPVVSIVPLPLESNGAPPVRYYLAESLAPDVSLLPNLRWIESSAARQRLLLDSQDIAALNALNHLELQSPQQGPFAKPGWFQEVSLWLRSAAAALALEWDGGFEQFNATDSFSLIRFATNPRALWFKAVGGSFATEFHVSRLMARKLPDCVPRLVAAREDWLAWLTEECPGTSLDAIAEFSLWQDAASTLARLQIASTAFVPELLDARAYPLARTLSHASVDRLQPIARNVLSGNTQSAREVIVDGELADIEETLRQCIETISKSGIPDALGHLDLNAGNVVVSPDRCVYLDWAEAYAGFPFLSFEYLLQSFRRVFGASSPQEREFVETYLSSWKGVASHQSVEDAWPSTPVLAVFAYFLRCIDRCEGEVMAVPGRAEYLSFLLRKLKREAVKARLLSQGAPR